MKLSPQEIHDLKEVYEFFNSIPEEKWCKYSLITPTKQRCAVGHLSYGSPLCMKIISIIIKYNPEVTLDMKNDSEEGTAKQNTLSYIKEILNAQ